jgi:ketosteroid isomerase-like protein
MRHAGNQVMGCLFVVAMVLFGLCAPAAQAEDVRAAIEKANKDWEACVARGDGAGLASLYTATAQLLPPNSDFVTGTQAIGQFLQGVLNTGIRAATLKTLEVEPHGKTAYEVGQYELRDQAGKVLDHGKYVVVWKREGARWKLHRDIWTTSMPPAKQP